jgi:hypothetical protein
VTLELIECFSFFPAYAHNAQRDRKRAAWTMSTETLPFSWGLTSHHFINRISRFLNKAESAAHHFLP